MSKLATCAEIAKIAEAAAAFGGLVVAGWWFIEQRENYPRADVSQSTTIVHVAPDVFAVEVNVSIKNEGKKQLKLHHVQVLLQAVSADPFDYRSLSTLRGQDYWQADRPRISNQKQFYDGELRWPVITRFPGPVDHHIEPGETDNIVLTFLLRCSGLRFPKSTPIRSLRIATDVFKPATEEGRDFAWKARGFVDISKECKA
jgi:hypothetical protein